MRDITTADRSARAQSDAPCDMMMQGCKNLSVSRVISVYFAIKKESKPSKEKTAPVNVSFEKISTSVVGATVYIVVDTVALDGAKITVQILGSKVEVLVPVDQPLPVLVDEAETTSLTANVGNWASKTNYANAATLEHKAIFELKLERDTKKKTADWRTEIGKQKPKKAYLHVKATAEGGNETEYTCEDDNVTSPSKEASTFYNRKNTYFQLSGCYCDKDFEVWEIKAIYPKASLFSAKNCPLPTGERTFEKLTEALNKAMNARTVTSCLRKAHFLSQADGETGLNTTVEYASGWDYDSTTHKAGHDLYEKTKSKQYRRAYDRYNECIKHGHTTRGDGPKYKGRGLIQLTWKDTYIAYLGTADNPEVVAESLEKSCDSATWFWTSRSTWGDLNPHADDDDFIYVTVGINGGLNGFDARKSSLRRILRWMEVKDTCINQKVSGKVLGEYKYSTSAMRNTKWGRDHSKSIEAHDD